MVVGSFEYLVGVAEVEKLVEKEPKNCDYFAVEVVVDFEVDFEVPR